MKKNLVFSRLQIVLFSIFAASVLTACGSPSSDDSTDELVATTSPQSPHDPTGTTFSRNDLQQARLVVHRKAGGDVLLTGQLAGDHGTLLPDSSSAGFVAEAACDENCRHVVMNVYQVVGSKTRMHQFVSSDLASHSAMGMFVGRPLSETGAKVLGTRAATAPSSDREQEVGPWLDLAAGGVAVGPAGTTKTDDGPRYGELANATQLPAQGTSFRRMNDGSQSWGTGYMISLLENASATFHQAHPADIVCVGAIAKEHGGLFAPHNGHQNGTDADIYFMGRTKYETVLDANHQPTDKFDKAKNWEFFRLVYGQKMIINGKTVSALSRIFLAPELKASLCQWAREQNLMADPDNAEIMRRIRPTAGHDNHFHVRLRCSPHQPLCQQEVEPPAGTGC